MVIKQEVAYGIVQGLADFWKCDELQDFTVTLGTTKFGCHRFLLAACSLFFKGLFRSGMKETEVQCVTVEGISSETFELILETLYTGQDVLTKDNVIDIWKAAHQLQIHFLITECENFAKTTLSLDNYIEYYKIANLFESKEVLEIVWSFILKNANVFFQSDFFLEMQVFDILNLIKCQDLKITSEDDVVQALLKWVEFASCKIDTIPEDLTTKGNEISEVQHRNKDMPVRPYVDNRNEQLPVLLTNTRTCLLSPKCLEMLIRHPLIRESKVPTDIIVEALLYQFQVGKRIGWWPPAAIYRNHGNYVNTAVAIRKNTNETIIKIKAFSFLSKKWLTLTDLFSTSIAALVAIDKSLYAFGKLSTVQLKTNSYITTSNLFKLSIDTWLDLNIFLNLPSQPTVVVADANIYILVSSSGEVWQLDPTTGRSIRKADLLYESSIIHVANYEQFIIVFYFVADVKDAMAVCCFDTSRNKWERLDNINGPAAGVISFKHSHSTYLIQTNGNLWMAEPQPNKVKFKYLAKLWSCDWPLHGAVTFRDELYIYGVKSETLKQDLQKQTSLDGIFSQIVYMESEDTVPSTFIPLTLSRQCIRQF
uniref:BTB domain-containing protein n=1 Tax=Biomphalaria glabrata TaxID=6526 RepID=A0A2C9M187_BIOGL